MKRTRPSTIRWLTIATFTLLVAVIPARSNGKVPPQKILGFKIMNLRIGQHIDFDKYMDHKGIGANRVGKSSSSKLLANHWYHYYNTMKGVLRIHVLACGKKNEIFGVRHYLFPIRGVGFFQTAETLKDVVKKRLGQQWSTQKRNNSTLTYSWCGGAVRRGICKGPQLVVRAQRRQTKVIDVFKSAVYVSVESKPGSEPAWFKRCVKAQLRRKLEGAI